MATSGLISLDEPDTPPPAGININLKDTPALSTEQLNERVQRIDTSLGALSPGAPAIQSSLVTGNEPELREQVATQRDVVEAQQRLRLIEELGTKENVSPEDVAKLQRAVFTDRKPTDPAAILETSFADHQVETLAPSVTHPEIKGISKDVAAKQEIINTASQELAARGQEQGWGGFAADVGGQLIPFLYRSRINGDGSLFTGNALEEERDRLLALPPTEFKKAFQMRVDELADQNLQMAKQYVEAFHMYSPGSKALDNILMLGDILDTGLALKGAKAIPGAILKEGRGQLANLALKESKATLSAREQAVAARDAVKASALPMTEGEARAAQVGRIEEAAVAGAARKMSASASVEETVRSLPSLFRIPELLGDASTLSREARDRLVNFLSRGTEQAEGILGVATRVSRAPEEAYRVGAEDLKMQMEREFSNSSDSIIDVKINRIEPNAANVQTVTLELGTDNATLFPDKETARFWADQMYGLPDNGYELFQRGDHFGIAVTRAVDETTDVFRNAAIQTMKKNPDNLVDHFIDFLGNPGKVLPAWLKSADESLPEFQNAQRKAAEMGMARTLKLIKEVANETPRLTKAERANLQSVLEYNRLVGQTDRARWFTVNELEDAYLLKTGRVPSLKEMGAYYNYVKINDLDWALRNFTLYRDKATRGLREYSFNFKTVAGDDNGVLRPQFKDTPFFDGKQINDLPWSSHTSFSYLYYDHDTHTAKVLLSSDSRTMAAGGIPPVAPGTTRIYRGIGNNIGAPGHTAFFTTDPKKAAQYGTVHYTDITDKERYHFAQGHNGPDELVTDNQGIIGRVKPYSEDANLPLKEKIREGIKSGELKVVQVYRPTSRPLAEVANTREVVEYVIARDINDKPLRGVQLDYTPGGHVDYQHEWYVKQPRIYTGQGGKLFYEGDTTLFNVSSRKEAQERAEALNRARIIMAGGDDRILGEFLKKNLPWDVESFKKLFGDTSDTLLSKDHDFHVVQRGENSYTSGKLADRYPGIKNYNDSEHSLADEIGQQYVGARSGPLQSIKQEIGTDGNPVFKFTPAKQIDPLATIGRAISNAANARFLGDYKISAAEDFIRRYAKNLDVPLHELEANPIFHLMNPKWIDKSEGVWEAKAARAAITNLIGAKTPLGMRMEALKQRLLSATYEAGGQVAADRLSVALGRTGQDPANFFRSIAFETKMGLFNIAQLPLQAATLVQTLAISPKHGLAAAMSYVPVRIALRAPTEANIAHAANIMEKIGLWKAGDFKEAVKAMIDSGWDRVGKEASWRNDLADPVMFKPAIDGVASAAGALGRQFLDKGRFFFEEGERINRIAGYMTAFREWKEANPMRALSQEARSEILNRADLLTNNMTRASQAGWQKGILSIPTQFWGYNARMADQLLGKRLTQMEKARLMLGYSAVWGVPASMAAATYYPWYEDVKMAAMERGMDGNMIVKALVEGLPTTIAGALGMDEKNFAQRYGPGGIRLLGQIAHGDVHLADIITGASGSITGEMFKNMSPLLGDTYEMFKEGGSYDPVLQDFIEVGKSVSTVNAAVGIAQALNVGKYFSKSGRPIDDVTTQQMVFKALTGLDPLTISDARLKEQSMRLQKEVENSVKAEFRDNYLKYFREVANGNNKLAEAYLRKAKMALIKGDITLDKQGQFLHDALRGSEDAVTSAEDRFVRNAPQSQYQERYDARQNKRMN